MDNEDIYIKLLRELDNSVLPPGSIGVHIILDGVGCNVLCQGMPATMLQKIAKAAYDVIQADCHEPDSVTTVTEN